MTIAIKTASLACAYATEIDAKTNPVNRFAKNNSDNCSNQKSPLFDLVIRLVALSLKVCVEELANSPRGNQATSRARQISAYLLHTTFSVPLAEIGFAFGKDRTTIGHACRIIEDLRDDPEFDETIRELEEALHPVLKILTP